MGGGTWDADVYKTRTAVNHAAHGTSFVYDSTAKARGVYEVHPDLDPKKTAAAGPFAGKVVRESRDSDEHPESTPIAVFFDVTGSMGRLPQVFQQKLTKLYGLLLAKGYVEHPQILFGAIGDGYADRVPLQVGQFESDNRADEALENIFLEGNGGGGNHESYELAMYYVARHTETDAWDKRGKKGYAFFIGDERVYSAAARDQIKNLIGDSVQDAVPTKDIVRELKQKWDPYFIFAPSGSYSPDNVLPPQMSTRDAYGWREVLGQNALILDDADAVCETIALTIGLAEGSVDLDTGLDDLASVGADAKSIAAAGKSLATVGAGAVASTGSASGDLDLSDDDGLTTV